MRPGRQQPSSPRQSDTMKGAILLIFFLFTVLPVTGQTVHDAKWRKRIRTTENPVTGGVTAFSMASVYRSKYYYYIMSYTCQSEADGDDLTEMLSVDTSEYLYEGTTEVNVRWDDSAGKEGVWPIGLPPKSFLFSDMEGVVGKMFEHDTVVIEIPSSNVFLRIDLANARESIAEAKNTCLRVNI